MWHVVFGALLGLGFTARVTLAAPTATAPCTVTAFAGVPSATASCTNIVLSNIAVPASEKLDLSSLLTNTIVTFTGTTVGASTTTKGFAYYLICFRLLDMRLQLMTLSMLVAQISEPPLRLGRS